MYSIEGTLNLDNHSCFNNKNTYPNFQKDLHKFKNHIKSLVENNTPSVFYKFGDGDFRFLTASEVGSAKPGNRALSKPYSEINLKSHLEGAQKCDHYTCEIYPENRKMFKSVINKNVDYPAEFGYGLVGNKWFFRNFRGKIGLIGAKPKLKLIEKLLEHDEYKEYLGLDKFEDYIYFPQKYAADDLSKLEELIKPQLEKSVSKIFLLGIGHAKSGILHKFSQYKNSIYLDVGGGIDMIAGCINTKRPYAGNWTNYRLKDYNYSDIDYMKYNHRNEKLLEKKEKV